MHANPTALALTVALALASTFGGLPRSAAADEAQVVGHMTPLPSEELASPIILSGRCSAVVVREWEVDGPGSARTPAAIRLLDRLCNRAVKAFPKFVERQGLEAKVTRHPRFSWNVALIPDGYGYRRMNDRKFRFLDRMPPGDLWAYTARDPRYVFLTNQVFERGARPRHIWEVSWVHELFHAMSMNAGIFDSHSSSDLEKAWIDEEYAERFQREVFP